ncbi:arginine--tRNA ligase [candidate division WWE3 bacterium CG_4_9_14_0_2_um_filter_48_10]|uniref:Arginine--tRNA ligase n=1 Tax=candidate division WWE3 bacterium CG_4_9_14_0_2_um_filter_48_10 TaxID=1975078 RepID=A0A2M8EJX8_UNCKA|nr:MAG: arginine--tRNA ligase [candidate division WWE3 bacterium CG_4_9_14_0_2_um_filter_48_10]
MSFKSEIEQAVRKQAKKLFDLESEPSLEHPKNEDFGDYATGVSLTIASELKADSLEIAHQLKESLIAQLPTDLIDRVEVVSPGFINFWLAPETLVKEVNRINKLKGDYGKTDIGKGKTVLVDYSSPNIAKPFGVGHLRSTIIGQALYNLYSFAGWKAVGENYLGDWGTQFGKLIYAVLKWGDLQKLARAGRIKELEKLYVKFHQEAEKDPSLEEKAREWFKRLEDGDKEAMGLWKKFREWSIVEFERIYKLLGMKFDKMIGESFFVTQAYQVIKEAKAKGVAIESEGALVIPFPEEAKLPPLILLKSDEATTYESRDLAAIKVRKKKYHPDLFLYETGVEQALRFRQLFLAAQMLGYGTANQFVHIGHGLYRLPEGKISTRLGRTVHLEEVLEEAISKARKIVEEKSPSWRTSSQKEKVSKAVGIGAVKYNDLSRHYSTEVIFDWGKMLSLEGNSAPYLQYTYARAKSVLRKAKVKKITSITQLLNNSITDAELPLLRFIYRFPEVVEEAVVTYSPNLLCNFLFDLAQRFNRFYDRVPILKAESSEVRALRLGLTAAVAQVIKTGLTLLGIETLEKL